MTECRWMVGLAMLCMLVGCGEGRHTGSRAGSQVETAGPRAAGPHIARSQATPVVAPTVRRRPCSDPGVADARLIVPSMDGTHGQLGHQSVTVLGDGRVSAQRVRDSMPVGPPVQQRLSAGELERARRLAHEVLAEPAAPLALPPQGFDTLVIVYSDPPVSGRPGTNDAYGRAYSLLSPLLERAFPPAAYRLTLSLGAAPPDPLRGQVPS